MEPENLQCCNDIYEQAWWLNLVAEGQWVVVEVKEKEEVIARMPYVIEKTILGNKIKMPIQTQTLGPWIKKNDNVTGNKNATIEKEIVARILEQLPKHYYLKLMLDCHNSYVLPYYWQGYRLCPRYSYRIKELSNVKKTYENFWKKTKGCIKAAEKKVRVSEDYNFEQLYRLIEQTYRKQNRRYATSKETLQKITDKCEERKQGKMFSAIDNEGHVHACAYFIYDSKVCYYFKSGSDPNYRSSGAASLLLWEGIKLASAVSKEFDFEGSMVEGIENFFRGFGGEIITYYEVQKLPLLYDIWESCKPKVKKMLGYKI